MVRVELLNDVSFFKTIAANTVIIGEGDETCKQMHVILEGKAGVFKDYGKQSQVRQAELGPGDFFGEAQLFLDMRGEGAVVSLTRLKTLMITRDNAYRFFEKDPAATYMLIQSLCARIYGNPSAVEAKVAAAPPVAEAAPARSATEATQAKPAVMAPVAETISEKKITGGSIFPAGHKRYALPDANLKESLLRNEPLTCPICGNKFEFPYVRTVVLRVLSTDCDMRRNCDGINLTHYLVATCPKCLFSAITDEYGKASKHSRAKALEITQKHMAEVNVPVQAMDANTIFTRLYLALAYAPVCFDNPEMLIARIWINISWLYRDCGDEDMEKYAMKQALQAYTNVYTNIKLGNKAEQTVCLILGELNYKLGDRANAKKFFFAAKTNREGSPVFERLAEDRLSDIRMDEQKQ